MRNKGFGINTAENGLRFVSEIWTVSACSSLVMQHGGGFISHSRTLYRGSTMSVQYYRKYELEGRTYGVVYEDSSNNFGKVLALRDDGELEPKVSTLK